MIRSKDSKNTNNILELKKLCFSMKTNETASRWVNLGNKYPAIIEDRMTWVYIERTLSVTVDVQSLELWNVYTVSITDHG